MLTFCVDLVVQINIVNEIRRVTAIARLEKGLNGEKAMLMSLWKYDERSTTEAPHWSLVKEKDNSA